MAREDDLKRIVAGARADGLSEEQITALLKRYDAVSQPAQPEEKSIGGFAGNLGTDLAENAVGVLQAFNPMTYVRGAQAKAAENERIAKDTRPFVDLRRAVRGDRSAAENLTSGAQTMATELPGQLADFAYEKPVTTALALSPVRRLVAKPVTALAATTGRGLHRVARHGVQSHVKPVVAELKLQRGDPLDGLQGASNRLTDLMLEHRWTTPNQAAKAVRQAEAEIRPIRAASTATTDIHERLPRYLNTLARSAEEKILQGGDPATIRAALDEAKAGGLGHDVVQTVPARPPAIGNITRTVRELRDDVGVDEAIVRGRAQGRWDNRKAYGELKGAQQEASKAVERAARDAAKVAEPALRPLFKRQSEALRLHPILDRMALRQGNRDLVSLPAWISAAGGQGAVKSTLLGLAAELMRRGQLRGAYGLDTLGQGMRRNAGMIGTATPLAALLAQLQGEDEDEP